MDLLSIIASIIIGLIQGILELFPVSSSLHLILFNKLFFTSNIEHNLEIFIQLSSAFALICRNRVIIDQECLCSFESNAIYKHIIINSLFASLPIFLISLFFRNISTLALSAYAGYNLILFGILLIFCDKFVGSNKINSFENIKVSHSIFIGFCQSLSVLPGVSRLGITILSSLFLGFSRDLAIKFSFLISIPAIFGAVIYGLLLKGGVEIGCQFLLSSFIAFCSTFFFITFALSFLNKSFFAIGLYRIVFGILYIAFLY